MATTTTPAAATNGSNGIHGTNGVNGTNGTNGTHTADGVNGSADFAASLTKILEVRRSDKAFASGAYSLVTLPAGAVFTPIRGATPAPKRWSSVQVSPGDDHIELNSDLVFCNHSCAPSLEFDMSRYEIRVARDVPGGELREGDALTFFYPSTEWDMSQPFECTCGAEGCLGRIAGAGQMAEGEVRRYWLNPHIEELLRRRGEQDGATTTTAAKA